MTHRYRSYTSLLIVSLIFFGPVGLSAQEATAESQPSATTETQLTGIPGLRTEPLKVDPESQRWATTKVNAEAMQDPELIRRMMKNSLFFGQERGRRFASSTAPIRGFSGYADHLLRAVGFRGEGQRSEDYGFPRANRIRFGEVCPTDMVAIGIHGRSGALIDSLGIICGDRLGKKWNLDAHGGSGGSPFRFECAPGARIRQIFGTYTREAISGLRVTCTDPAVARVFFANRKYAGRDSQNLMLPIARNKPSDACGSPLEARVDHRIGSATLTMLDLPTPRLVGIGSSPAGSQLYLEHPDVLDPVGNDRWSSRSVDGAWPLWTHLETFAPGGGIGFSKPGIPGLCASDPEASWCRDHWIALFERGVAPQRLEVIQLVKTPDLSASAELIETRPVEIWLSDARLIGWLASKVDPAGPDLEQIRACEDRKTIESWVVVHDDLAHQLLFYPVRSTSFSQKRTILDPEGQRVSVCERRTRVQGIDVDGVSKMSVDKKWDYFVVAGATSRYSRYLVYYDLSTGETTLNLLDVEDSTSPPRFSADVIWRGQLLARARIEAIASPQNSAIDLFAHQQVENMFQVARVHLANAMSSRPSFSELCKSEIPGPASEYRMFAARRSWVE